MITTINEAKERNTNAGYHWFSPESLRFFSSRLPKTVLPVDNGALFVSSERCGGQAARFTVRFIHDDGHVETVGEFQQYAGRESATRRAEKLQREWKVEV